MAAAVSAWAKPGAWALDAEENETELLKQHKEDATANTNGAGTVDFPSLSAAAATKTKEKKKQQTLSLQEFFKPDATQPKGGLMQDELLTLPTGPRQRTAEELDRNKLGGGFRSYGVGMRDEQPRRQGSFNRESNREFAPSRADETDNWATGKKSPAGPGGRRERGERGGFFTDSQSRADEVDNWTSKKNFVPLEPRRHEKRGSFGLESGSVGSDSDNWLKRKEEEKPRIGGSFDSLRERRGGSDADSEIWGRRRDESSNGSGRPKLNLQPRTLPVGEVQGEKEEPVGLVKPKNSNPFGEARPREEVLKEKGQDWKEIEEKLESMKVKEVTSSGPKRTFWSGNGRDRTLVEEKNAWRKPETVGSRPPSACKSENGSAVNSENGHAEEAEEKGTQL